MKEKAGKEKDSVQSREEYLYHNTEKLLRCYRDVVWSIEVSAIQAQISFELEFDCKIDEFLEMSYAAGADLSGTDIEEQMRTVERNKKMLRIIDAAVNALRKKQLCGETYYWILHYTYLSEKQYEKTEDIVTAVGNHVGQLSWKTYFKKRRQAIECLSTILWGFTSRECMPVLKEFVNKNNGGNKKETVVKQKKIKKTLHRGLPGVLLRVIMVK